VVKRKELGRLNSSYKHNRCVVKAVNTMFERWRSVFVLPELSLALLLEHHIARCLVAI
jgi:hypothetical protein